MKRLGLGQGSSPDEPSKIERCGCQLAENLTWVISWRAIGPGRAKQVVGDLPVLSSGFVTLPVGLPEMGLDHVALRRQATL